MARQLLLRVSYRKKLAPQRNAEMSRFYSAISLWDEQRLMLRNDSLLSDILCCNVEAIIISTCLLRDENTATTIISWNMLEGTLEGVDGGLLLKNIEKIAQWIGFMKK